MVRRASEADLPPIVELMLHGAVPDRPTKENPDDLSRYRSALREIDAGDGAVLVADLHGEVVGVCQLIVFRHLNAPATSGATGCSSPPTMCGGTRTASTSDSVSRSPIWDSSSSWSDKGDTDRSCSMTANEPSQGLCQLTRRSRSEPAFAPST